MRAEGGAAEGAPAAMMEGVEQPGPAGAAAAGAGAGGGATTAASAHRLMIREMVLDNFKSYAGPQSVGPFHKVRLTGLHALDMLERQGRRTVAPGCPRCTAVARYGRNVTRTGSLLMRAQSFSSVVGPNGSGKSTVIDALLFVFGRRAKQVSQCVSTAAHMLTCAAAHARPSRVRCGACVAAALQQGVGAHPQLDQLPGPGDGQGHGALPADH